MIVQLQSNGTVVRTHDLGFDPGIFDLIPELFRDKEIVDSPPRISLPGSEAVGPPRVVSAFGNEHAEGVDISGSQELIDPLPFNGQKAGYLFVGFGVFEINLCMGRIHVPADHNWLFLAQSLGMVEKSIVEFHFVLQTFITHLAVGEVHVEYVEIWKLHLDQASFTLKALVWQFIDHALRLHPGHGQHTGIALLDLSGIPVLGIAFYFLMFCIQLFRIGLYFLQTDHVPVALIEPVPEPLVHYGPISIHIPGIYFHAL